MRSISVALLIINATLDNDDNLIVVFAVLQQSGMRSIIQYTAH